MKCPNCGRDNPDIRLFCAHCGELLPETEEPAQDKPGEIEADDDIRLYQRPVKTQDAAAPVFETTAAPDPDSSDDTEFYRRRQRARRVYEEAWPEDAAESPRKEIPSIFDMEEEETSPPRSEPVREIGHAPSLSKGASNDNGRPSTHLPPREEVLNPENFFDVRGHGADFDDETPISRKQGGQRRGYEFEDPDRQSFAVRHMRGIVTMALMLFTMAIVVIWAITPDAQETLARLDLAWSASAYEKLGLEAWECGDFAASGHYFTQALKRAPENSSYAVYAANSYMETGDMGKAADAIRKCIAAEPNNADYYLALIGIYSGYDNLPDADKQLVDEGYRRTGDSRLYKNN